MSRDSSLRDLMKSVARHTLNWHTPDGSPNVFVFTTPRSGSTWLMELIGTQPGFKSIGEPLNLRLPMVRRHLGLESWHELHDPEASDRLEPYFRGFCEGRLHFLDPFPVMSNAYRFRTRRIVFKILHGGEDRINWFRDTFSGRIVLLLRHPVAVSLSREVFPRLTALITSDYRTNFSESQLRLARSVIDSGSHLERGVLAWCLENAVPMRMRTPDWTVVTYEQLVLEPRPILEMLIERLDLVDARSMMDQLSRASGVKGKSDAATRALLETEHLETRQRLVYKWRVRVDVAAEQRCRDLLEAFEIDAYSIDDPLPSEALWLGDLDNVRSIRSGSPT